MKILLVDAYDSFVHIVANYLRVLNNDVDVIRCDKVDIAGIGSKYNFIVLGPGPGHPKDSGYLDILCAYEGRLPIFGVCLGMQAIAEYYGISVIKAASRKHGKISEISHTQQGCLSGLPSPMKVTRYHSLVADKELFPHPELNITAVSLDDNYIMALAHDFYAIEGVQFHPESVTTDHGLLLFKNALGIGRSKNELSRLTEVPS